MPRTARLDSTGVLHHLMIRGIEKTKIFKNDKDHDDFMERLESLCPQMGAASKLAFDTQNVRKKMDQIDEIIAFYDEEAEATGLYCPEVAFGLTYAHIQPGQSMLDIGIGTGLVSILFLKAGLEIHGMDISPQMLDVCRRKGFSSLHLHDLSKPPYPFDSESKNHAVCTGVFNFFSDLSPVHQSSSCCQRPS